ncbi:MAG: DUF4423 domain-containing protein [Proteobacteria bacterium]|nr:DUF4423 domain-containing protein [Pseudomonadota bacterium]
MNIFDFQDYRIFLTRALGARRGLRRELIDVLGCQSSFVSQVLLRRSHFSLEHGVKIAKFLRLSESETHQFMLLLQKDKAGSVELEQYFDSLIRESRRNATRIVSRMSERRTIDERDRTIYYSQWWYAATHILVAIGSITSRNDLKECLKIDMELIDEAVRFLISCGLVIELDDMLDIGLARIHIDDRDPLIARHHSNWRQHVCRVYEKNNRHSENFHFSGVIAISKVDADKIKNSLLESLRSVDQIIKESPCEEVYVLLHDFFKLS